MLHLEPVPIQLCASYIANSGLHYCLWSHISSCAIFKICRNQAAQTYLKGMEGWLPYLLKLSLKCTPTNLPKLEQPCYLPAFIEGISKHGPMTQIIIVFREVEHFDTVLWGPTGYNSSTRNICDSRVTSTVVGICKFPPRPANSTFFTFQHFNGFEVLYGTTATDHKDAAYFIVFHFQINCTILRMKSCISGRAIHLGQVYSVRWCRGWPLGIKHAFQWLIRGSRLIQLNWLNKCPR